METSLTDITSKSSSKLVFFVNGKKIVEEDVNPEWTLLQYLRIKLRLCGTKLGCGEGGCGACTVMVSKFDRQDNKVIHFPVNACLAPVCSMHGMAVTTVEGIGSTRTRLHPVQERIAKAHGSQCGFCTPGMVMSMYTLLRNMEKPRMEDLEVAFQGNLCRCTGYRPIIEGYKTFTEEWEKRQVANVDQNPLANGGCMMGDKCCKMQKCIDLEKEQEGNRLFNANEFLPYDQSQEPIFPPELKLNSCYDEEFLVFKNESVTWYRPVGLDHLLQLKAQFPEAKLVIGNTEIGVEVKFKNQLYPEIIQPTMVNELTQITISNDGVTIGAATTLDTIENVFKKLIETNGKTETRVLTAAIEMLHWFAGKQIRSVASIGGNIMTGSPISDLNPVWMAAGAMLKLRSLTGTRSVPMDDCFYTGYRKTLLQSNEILESITVPFTKPNQYFYAHKQARRRDDDIAIVNAAMSFTLKKGHHEHEIESVRMAFGGMAPTTILSKNIQKLIGMKWNDEMLERAYALLIDELQLSEDAPGGMINYRRTLPMSFLFRTYLNISQELNIALNLQDISALHSFKHQPPSSTHFFEVSNENNEINPVGKPIVHVSAFKQASGEAMYLDDMPHLENELYLALVYSTRAHAKILRIDTTKALEMQGIIGFVSAKDIPKERNKVGPVCQDEELFISEIVTCQYQTIGGILGVDQMIAQKAAKLVDVEYEDLQPIIVSIDDAIEQNSMFPIERRIEVGNVDEAFKNAEHTIEGTCRTGYQEHFYFETHGCLAIPRDGDELELFVSNQHHAETTDFVSRILDMPQSKIVTRIKRIGGGFGGKQSRGVPIAVAAAVAAQKYHRPVRIILDRDEDMAMTGGRHPYLVKYKAAFTSEGKITAWDTKLYANGGYSHDLSLEVLERAVYHVDNCYKIPNLRVVGKICKTNLPTNTAFRGFGAPQTMFAAENMIRDISEYLKVDHVEIAARNLYVEGDLTHYNQPVLNCNLKRCFNDCLEQSNYFRRKQEIEDYNVQNRWKKKGLAVVATKYGVGFGVPFLEQSGCLVNIYTDGSVLVTYGGVEMGQGLNTKMIQIAAKVLEVPPEIVQISECATDKVPNSSPTAASVGSDLNGMAVLAACQKLKSRLDPLRTQHHNASWAELIKLAYFDRINLSAIGHFKTPNVYHDWETNTGTPYNYYTYGAACTEVEIDCLTGDHQVLRTDIVMDLGTSLNPAIDIGQVEGAFMQGYGLFVMEEMLYSPTGTVYSRGPGAYKIPGFSDIPNIFNVSLLKGSSNPRAVFSSKAVGEPPLFLASSALFGIREAIINARKSHGVKDTVRLNAPATAEKIRMLCHDNMVDMVQKGEVSKKGCSWNVIP